VIISPNVPGAGPWPGTAGCTRCMPAMESPRHSVAGSKEPMKPVRWLVIAIASASLGFLAIPGTAQARVVHHASKSVGSMRFHGGHRALSSRASRSPVSSQRSPQRSPAHPSNRPKAHRSAPGNRGRGQSPYGLLPQAPDARPDDDPGIPRLGDARDNGARLSRMLESRGPPRAGPHRITAFRGFLPPSSACLSSSAELLVNTPTNRLIPVRFIGPHLAARLEGTAAGPNTPSGGSLS